MYRTFVPIHPEMSRCVCLSDVRCCFRCCSGCWRARRSSLPHGAAVWTPRSLTTSCHWQAARSGQTSTLTPSESMRLTLITPLVTSVWLSKGLPEQFFKWVSSVWVPYWIYLSSALVALLMCWYSYKTFHWNRVTILLVLLNYKNTQTACSFRVELLSDKPDLWHINQTTA